MASLKVRSNALVVDTRSIAFKMSRDFYCKARQSKSVLPIILCIKYKMNINSKDFITIKQPPASPCIELKDPS
jgi:5-methylcytosine-specific restriction endonuclease McrBC regulatory subunit McrC